MVTTTRATSSIPGATGRRYHGENQFEHFFLWRSRNPRPQTGLLWYIKPGHAFNMGERVLDPHTSSSPALGDAIDLLYDDLDWPIVSCEFRPPCSADSPTREPFSARPWPGPLLSLIKFGEYLREHAHNEELWGPGASIDWGKSAVLGSSWGHTAGLLLACIPPGHFPGHAVAGLHQRISSGLDHRPAAVCGFIGQIDWTQWTPDPDDATGPFAYDVHQYFFSQRSRRTWSSVPKHIKASASPWWWLPFLEAGRTAFWGSWGTRPTNGAGRNLTPSLWLPGTVQDGKASGKMFKDPHHYFQAKPWEDALRTRRIRNRIIWGDSSDNPQGSNNSGLGASTATTAADLHRFITRDLGWR